jgi:hypothetical protein
LTTRRTFALGYSAASRSSSKRPLASSNLQKLLRLQFGHLLYTR